MNKNILKLSAVVALAGMSVMGLSACTSNANDAATPSPSASESVIGKDTLSPVTIDVAQVSEGSEVKTIVGVPVNINTADGAQGDWTGSSSDETVASFVAGSVGETVLNPGVVAKAPGQATIKMVNSKTGETKEFVVNVNAKV